MLEHSWHGGRGRKEEEGEEEVVCTFDALYLHNTEGLPGNEIGSVTEDSQKEDGYFMTVGVCG